MKICGQQPEFCQHKMRGRGKVRYFCIFMAIGILGSSMAEDKNVEQLEWRIFPTSVVPDPLVASRTSQRNAREEPVSRDELLHDLLKEQHKEIHVEDFLWTGSGEGELPESDYVDPSGSDLDHRLDVKIMPTTLTVTQVSTLFIVKPTMDANEQHTDDGDDLAGSVSADPRLDPILPTPVVPSSSHPFVAPRGPRTLPKDEFIVRTILQSNMTILHNKVEDFKSLMEEKLTRAYRRAYERNVRRTRSAENEDALMFFPHGRHVRSPTKEFEAKKLLEPQELRPKRQGSPPRVEIHNIRSALPQPQIEVLYTVYQDEQPVPATVAVEALQEIEDSEVESDLGFPLVTKAEAYYPRPDKLVSASASQTHYLMAALIVSAFVIILVVLALVFLLHRAKRAGLNLKHSRLMGSPDHTTMESSHAQTTPGGSLDRKAFTLERPQSGKPALVRVASSQEVDMSNGRVSRAQTRSSMNQEGTAPLSRSSSAGGIATLGGESPSMADMSSNNGEDSPQRAKKGGGAKRKARNRATPTQGYSSGAELSQSAFPVPTPDRLGPLTDLLEEDDLPGESRDNSGRRRMDWAFLPRPKTPGSTTTSSSSSSESYVDEATQMSTPWHEEVAKTRELAKNYRKVLDETFGTQVEVVEDIEADEPADQADEDEEPTKGALSPGDSSMKKRAVSAKSHIFRKGKIETKLAKMGRHHRTRPWSAHESRLQADPIFHMRKRHWEGLISGKKKLHRGQLLPGSTSEEEESKRVKPTNCWSECSSPRKQVRLEATPPAGTGAEMATPLIKAIKEELQKFQRPKSPNLAGISIISDPDLLTQEK